MDVLFCHIGITSAYRSKWNVRNWEINAKVTAQRQDTSRDTLEAVKAVPGLGNWGGGWGWGWGRG